MKAINEKDDGSVHVLKAGSMVWVQQPDGSIKKLKVYDVDYHGGVLHASLYSLEAK